jgi:D-alanine transaminase
VKAIGLLANVLARDDATRAGSAEALFVRDGLVPEGASSNVFVVTAGEIRTPPNGPSLLPGVTRDVVLELAGSLGLATREVPVTATELMNAEEVWITSSVREMVAVVRVDGHPIGSGRPGPVYARLAGEFQAYKRRFAQGMAR